ncbi:MAG: TRAP transporter small permease [Candidatus Korobacteraceae bacterium]|jgi:TRAP-type C4-dicarboxylate transport system permease small subunit
MTKQQVDSKRRGFWYVVTDQLEQILLLLLGVFLLLDILTGIVYRHVHFDTVFAEELGKYLFIWFCCIGIAAAAKDNQHIRVDFFANKLPLNPKIIWLSSQVLFLCFAAFFFYVGLNLTLMHHSMGTSAPGFDFPMFVFIAAVPFGYGLTCIRLVQDIVYRLRHWDEKLPASGDSAKGAA